MNNCINDGTLGDNENELSQKPSLRCCCDMG